MFLHVARRMGPPVLMVVAYAFVAALVLQWDMQREGGQGWDFGESLYALYTQLFFQPSEPFPHSTIARLLFCFSPVVGAVLIFQGVFKVSAELLNPDPRQKLWVRLVSQRMSGHVVVCGLGHVGYRILEELISLGEGVVAIERRDTDSFVPIVKGMNVPVIIDDARRDEVLIAAGIEKAKAVVCATNDDLANLEVAIDSKRMNPGIRVVMRMFDQRLASKVGGALDVDRTFSTSALSAPLVAFQATQAGIRAAYRLEDGTVRVTAEIVTGKDFEPTKVEDVEDVMEARVIAVRHQGNETFAAAKGSTMLLAGDLVVVDTKGDKLAWVRKTLHGVFHDPPLEKTLIADRSAAASLARSTDSD